MDGNWEEKREFKRRQDATSKWLANWSIPSENQRQKNDVLVDSRMWDKNWEGRAAWKQLRRGLREIYKGNQSYATSVESYHWYRGRGGRNRPAGILGGFQNLDDAKLGQALGDAFQYMYFLSTRALENSIAIDPDPTIRTPVPEDARALPRFVRAFEKAVATPLNRVRREFLNAARFVSLQGVLGWDQPNTLIRGLQQRLQIGGY